MTIAEIGWPFPMPLAIVTKSGTTPAYVQMFRTFKYSRDTATKQHTSHMNRMH